MGKIIFKLPPDVQGSMRERAKKLGLSPSWFCRKPTEAISFNTLAHLCAALSCQPGDLLIYEDHSD